MRSRNPIILCGAALMGALVVAVLQTGATKAGGEGRDKQAKPDPKKPPFVRVVKTEAEWKKILSPQVFDVTRKAGTEPAFHNEYWNNHKPGTYRCADCG